MGYFSFVTCDTLEQVKVGDFVYLLNPDGENIAGEYDGYGRIGGRDVFGILADWNLPQVKDQSEEVKESFGGSLHDGSVVYDEEKNKYFSFSMHDRALIQTIGEHFVGTYGTIQPDYGKTPNDLIDDGTWKKVSARDLMMKGREFKALKFSFNKDAKFSDEGPSVRDPNQGCTPYTEDFRYLSEDRYEEEYDSVMYNEEEEHFQLQADSTSWEEMKAFAETLAENPRHWYRHVWTSIDGDDGTMYLNNGVRVVNRMDYWFSRNPWGCGIKKIDDETFIQVAWEGQNDWEYGAKGEKKN